MTSTCGLDVRLQRRLQVRSMRRLPGCLQRDWLRPSRPRAEACRVAARVSARSSALADGQRPASARERLARWIGIVGAAQHLRPRHARAGRVGGVRPLPRGAVAPRVPGAHRRPLPVGRRLLRVWRLVRGRAPGGAGGAGDRLVGPGLSAGWQSDDRNGTEFGHGAQVRLACGWGRRDAGEASESALPRHVFGDRLILMPTKNDRISRPATGTARV
jgi:hypothetical protein